MRTPGEQVVSDHVRSPWGIANDIDPVTPGISVMAVVRSIHARCFGCIYASHCQVSWMDSAPIRDRGSVWFGIDHHVRVRRGALNRTCVLPADEAMDTRDCYVSRLRTCLSL